MRKPKKSRYPQKTATELAIVFDLDGTLVDSVYEHVISWKQAFREHGLEVPGWMIHNKIGMSGSVLLRQLLTETRQKASPKKRKGIEALHKAHFNRRIPLIRSLPGVRELLHRLTRLGVRWAIGTGGDRKAVTALLEDLRIPVSVPIVTGDDVREAKPQPDIFMLSAERLGVSIHETIIVGDSVWDLLAASRAKALSIGLLSGGYSRSDLERAGAYRVYNDPADLLTHLEELGLPGDSFALAAASRKIQ
jgi:phosphoglycolate phosphatase-like HAD superfamily hydrolase